MVPREPEEDSGREDAASMDSEEDSESNTSDPAKESNQGQEHSEGTEEEYHTEESDDEVAKEQNDGSGSDTPRPSAPLLPEELLKPLPSPAYSLQDAVTIPWDQMTRPQKRAERNRNRQSKKKVWDRLRRETQGTGVIEAGKAAQIKRGLIRASDRVKAGRVGKKTKTQISGRQQLLEQRKRLIDQNGSALMRPSKRARTGSKR